MHCFYSLPSVHTFESKIENNFISPTLVSPYKNPLCTSSCSNFEDIPEHQLKYSNCLCRVPGEVKTTYHRFPWHVCAMSKLMNLKNCGKPVRDTKSGFRWSCSCETGHMQDMLKRHGIWWCPCLENEPPTSNGIFAYFSIFRHFDIMSHLSNSNGVRVIN